MTHKAHKTHMEAKKVQKKELLQNFYGNLYKSLEYFYFINSKFENLRK